MTEDMLYLIKSTMRSIFKHETSILKETPLNITPILLYSIFFNSYDKIDVIRKRVKNITNNIIQTNMLFLYQPSLAYRKPFKDSEYEEGLEILEKWSNDDPSNVITVDSLLGIIDWVEIKTKLPDIAINENNQFKYLIRNILSYNENLNVINYQHFNQELVVVKPSLSLSYYEINNSHYWSMRSKRETIPCNILKEDVINVIHIIQSQIKKEAFHNPNFILLDSISGPELREKMKTIHQNYKFFKHFRVDSNFFLSDLNFLSSQPTYIKKYFAELDTFILKNYKSDMMIRNNDPRILSSFLQEEVNRYMYSRFLNIKAIYINREIILFNNDYSELLYEENLFKTFIRDPSKIRIRLPSFGKLSFNDYYIKITTYYRHIEAIKKKERVDSKFNCVSCHEKGEIYTSSCHIFCNTCVANHNS